MAEYIERRAAKGRSKSMGKKYIIELEDKPFHNGNGDFLYRVKGFNSLVFDMTGVGKLTPYTEPDLEQQVRNEAFKNGYDAAYKDIDIKSKINAAYRKGLEDAWEAARKIVTMPNRDFINSDILDLDPGESIFTKYTASEAIEKIRQYEQEKENEEIKVGDEVIAAFGKAVVTGVGPVHVEYVYAGGPNGFDKVKNVKKTGRHFPEIAEVLRKMKEE